MWFLTQPVAQVRSHSQHNDAPRISQNRLMDVATESHIENHFYWNSLTLNKMLLLGGTVWLHSLIHTQTYNPPLASHHTLPLHHTKPLLSHADLCVPIGLLPWGGQVRCQSGWHIALHSTNQQTALWWVSTLVVKVTFDSWEGYGSECWGDSSRQLVP